jgi:hypothetical protein
LPELIVNLKGLLRSARNDWKGNQIPATTLSTVAFFDLRIRQTAEKQVAEVEQPATSNQPSPRLRLAKPATSADAFSIATPADWQPGDDVIVPTAGSCGVAKERMESKDEMHCHDWFFCTKKLDKEKVLRTVLKK